MKALRPIYECAPKRQGSWELFHVNPVKDEEDEEYQPKAYTPHMDNRLEFVIRKVTKYAFSNATRRVPIWFAKEIQANPERLKQFLPRYSKQKQVSQKVFVPRPRFRRVKRMVKMKKKSRNARKKMLFIRRLKYPTTGRLYARWTITFPPLSHYEYAAVDPFRRNNATYEEEYESETGSSKDDDGEKQTH